MAGKPDGPDLLLTGARGGTGMISLDLARWCGDPVIAPCPPKTQRRRSGGTRQDVGCGVLGPRRAGKTSVPG